MTALATIPDTKEQGSLEDIVWGVDVTAQLTGTQTPTLPVVTLTKGGATVTLTDAAAVAGNVIRQRIRAGTLTQGRYTLTVLFTPSGTTNVLESVLSIRCPF